MSRISKQLRTVTNARRATEPDLAAVNRFTPALPDQAIQALRDVLLLLRSCGSVFEQHMEAAAKQHQAIKALPPHSYYRDGKLCSAQVTVKRTCERCDQVDQACYAIVRLILLATDDPGTCYTPTEWLDRLALALPDMLG